MVARFFLCLWILLWGTGIALDAQTATLLPELFADEASDAFWYNRLSELKALSFDIKSSDWEYRNTSFRSTLNLSEAAYKAYLAHYQQVDTELSYPAGNIIYMPNSKLQALIGNYRINFGRGILLGSNQGAGMINPYPNPQLYSPQGISLLFKHRRIDLSVFVSEQLRSYVGSDSVINYLPRAKSKRLAKTSETIGGVALSWQNHNHSAGLLYYRQDYGHRVNSSVAKPVDSAIAASYTFDNRSVSLDGEIAILDQEPAIKAVATYDDKKHSLQTAFSLYPQCAFAPYASPFFNQVKTPSAHEISLKAGYALSPKTQLYYRALMLKHNQDTSSSAYRQAHSYEFQHKHAKTSHSLSLAFFDREIITAIDSSFVSTIPMHLRISYRMRHNANKNIQVSQRLELRHEDKVKLHQKSFLYHSDIHIEQGSWQYQAELKSWHTLTSIYEPANDQDPDAYIITKSNTSLGIEICYSQPRHKISLRCQQLVFGEQNTYLWFSYRYRYKKRETE